MIGDALLPLDDEHPEWEAWLRWFRQNPDGMVWIMERTGETMKAYNRLIAAAVSAGLLVAALPAMSHERFHTDPNDTGGPLDMRRVGFIDGPWQGSDVEWVQLCVRTSRRWYPRILKRPGDIGFALDTRGNRRLEYTVYFRAGRSGKLGGSIYNIRADRRKWVAGFRWGNKRGGCVRFKRKAVAPTRRFVRYTAFTLYKGCQSYCVDSTPYRSHFMGS